MQDTIQIRYNGQLEPFWYIRLGALLKHIQDELMYIVEIDASVSPLLKFDTEVETNLMFIENLQVSVDPNICLVNRTIKDFNGVSYNFTNQNGQKADLFESQLFTGYNCYGQIMNIYVHMKWILLELDRLKNASTNKVVLIDFLNSILSAISSALGGINSLEANIDETTNTVIIRDKNPLPNLDTVVIPTLNEYYKSKNIDKIISLKSATFDLLGYSTKDYDLNNPVYNGMGHASFIKDFSLTTEISPNLSTMLTIGATANSEVVGENSTAFSRFNVGLTDRFKKNISEPKSEPVSQELLKQILPEALLDTTNLNTSVDKEQEALIGKYADTYSRYLGYLRELAAFKYNDGEAETYKNAVTNFTTYLQQIRQNAIKRVNSKYKGFLPSTGFIPFNMSITMDGLSGIKIYNKFNVNSEYLPTNYPDTVEFIIKSINHKIENNKWFTNLESIVISKGEYKATGTNTIPGNGGTQNGATPTVVDAPIQESVDADFWSLVAISAAENFIDNFQGMADVAQSIYNRLSAKVYGKSIKSIVVAPGQYEPTFKNLKDWLAIKNKETAITAYKNSRGISLEVATLTINNCAKALTSPLLKQNAKTFVGSRTEFLSAPPTSKDAVGVVEREPKNKNNAFFWNYSGKTLFYNKKILTAQDPPSNIPQLSS